MSDQLSTATKITRLLMSAMTPEERLTFLRDIMATALTGPPAAQAERLPPKRRAVQPQGFVASQAIMQALRARPEGLSPAALAQIVYKGKDKTGKRTRAQLGSLKQRGLVDRSGPGIWVALPVGGQ